MGVPGHVCAFCDRGPGRLVGRGDAETGPEVGGEGGGLGTCEAGGNFYKTMC